MQNEPARVIETLEKDGDLHYPISCTDLQNKVRENWSTDRGVMTFFEELPHKTFNNKEEIIKAGPATTVEA